MRKLFFGIALLVSFLQVSDANARNEYLNVEMVNGRPMIDAYMYGPNSDRGMLSLGLIWKDGDAAQRIQGYRFSLADSARLVSPRSGRCNITHIAGMMYSSDSPVPYGTLALQLQGSACRAFVNRVRNNNRFVFQFYNIPRTRSGVEQYLKLYVNVVR